MSVIFLSERNLRTLLSKLDRLKAGEETACTLIKHRGGVKYRQTEDVVRVTAVLDADFYEDQGREPGEVHPKDVPADPPSTDYLLPPTSDPL